MADGDNADNLLPFWQRKDFALLIKGAAHPAGAKAQGGGGQHQALAVIARLLPQVFDFLEALEHDQRAHAAEHAVALDPIKRFAAVLQQGDGQAALPIGLLDLLF